MNELSDEALGKNLDMLMMKYAINAGIWKANMAKRREELQESIRAAEAFLLDLRFELMQLEAEELGLEVGKSYEVTEEFHKIFPLILDTSVVLEKIQVDSDGDKMAVLKTSKWPISISLEFIKDYIICL